MVKGRKSQVARTCQNLPEAYCILPSTCLLIALNSSQSVPTAKDDSDALQGVLEAFGKASDTFARIAHYIGTSAGEVKEPSTVSHKPISSAATSILACPVIPAGL
jgi:hypothetical protein